MPKASGSYPAPLFARLETGASLHMNANAWVREIGEALSVLLNTHAGSAAIRADFGMTEFQPEEIHGVVRLQQKARQIKALIENFEPRLQQIQVEVKQEAQSNHRAVFEVHGLLDPALSGERVSYHTVMTGHGRVWLRK